MAAAAPRARPFPLRKQFLYQSTSKLLLESPLVLYLRPTDFSTSEWTALRAAMSQLPSDTSSRPRLTFLRAGMLPALRRDHPRVALPDSAASEPGSLAALTAETDPSTLKKLLRLLDKASATAGKHTPPVDPKKPVKIERLPVIGGTVDGRPLDTKQMRAVADMPPLSILRAQIVGLLQSPASNVVGSIGAGARTIARTLQGYRPSPPGSPEASSPHT